MLRRQENFNAPYEAGRHRRDPGLVLFVLVSAFLQPAPGMAQRILYVNSAASGFHDGSAWADAYIDLQDALDEAATPGRCTSEAPCEIWVAAGKYFPSKPTDPDDPRTVTFELRNNVAIYGGFAGWETERNQRDWDKNPTILDGDLLQNDDPAFEPTSNCCVARQNEPGCDDQACLKAVMELETERPLGRGPICHLSWITGCAWYSLNVCYDLCKPTGCDNAYHVVTARETDATAILDGVTITGGDATQPGDFGGGGVLLDHAGPTLRNCIIAENASTAFPAGLYSFYSEPVIANCTFLRNAGAGMMSTGGEPTVSDSAFIENQSAGWLSRDARRIVGCSFIGNTGTEFGGGGLILQGGAPTVRDSLFIDNSTMQSGGGVANSTFTQFINCGFFGNHTDRFGGGINHGGDGLILLNCVFSGNHAVRGGGAVEHGWGSALILNSTFVGNSAASIGGVAVGLDAAATISNSIFWNKEA